MLLTKYLFDGHEKWLTSLLSLAQEKHIDNFIVEHGTLNRIISGGASGVDLFAQKYANVKGIEFIVYNANWNKYGKNASPMRKKVINYLHFHPTTQWVLMILFVSVLD